MGESYGLYNRQQRWLAFFAISLVTIMINMDATIVNLALASISKTFQVSLSQMQWIINAYILAHVVFLIVAGRLADVFGRKKIYMIGIILFFLASIISGFSQNPLFLISGRVLQGVGFAFTLTLGILLVTTFFPKDQKGLALGSYMMVAGLAQALGPSLGGVIIELLSWRWIFFLNFPLSILAFIFVAYFCKSEKPTAPGEKVDILGFLFLGAGLALLTLSFNEMGVWGILSISFLLTMIGSFICLLAFYVKSTNTDHPLIEFNLFKNRRYLVINLIRSFYMYGWLSMLFILPLYLQNILEQSPMMTGLMIFCMTFVFGILSPVVGKSLDRFGCVWPTIFSLGLALASFLLLAHLKTTLCLPILISALVLFGISAPIIGSGSAIISLSSLPEKHTGVGMGAFYMIAFLGALIGVAISGSLISILSTHHFYFLSQSYKAIHLKGNEELLLPIIHGARSVKQLTAIFSLSDYKLIFPMVKQSFVFALNCVMYINAGLILVSLLLSRWLFKK